MCRAGDASLLGSLAKNLLPPSVRKELSKRRWQWRGYLESRRNRNRRAADVFSQIYRENTWGDGETRFFSGSGSRGPFVKLYCDRINEFIKEKNIKSVLDIGCGDFYVGRNLICEDYTGMDVVPDLVAYNNATFGGPGRRFICADAAGDEDLPPADLVLVRQVFQHLSNRQVETILGKLAPFRHVIVTEQQPAASDFAMANRDHVHGNGTRLLHGSGVYLELPPFSRSVELLLDCAGDDRSGDVHGRGPIRSFLVRA